MRGHRILFHKSLSEAMDCRVKPGNDEEGALAALLRHHDLAEVLVGFHVLEGFRDLAEWIDLVDRQF